MEEINHESREEKADVILMKLSTEFLGFYKQSLCRLLIVSSPDRSC